MFQLPNNMNNARFIEQQRKLYLNTSNHALIINIYSI